jgi:hypothetical protein
MSMRSALLLGPLVVATLGSSVAAQVSGTSPTCGPVNGKTTKDRNNAMAFCAQAVPKDLNVQGAIAMDMLLWVKISRPVANIMRADRLTTEQVVKNWMRTWKGISGSQSVTVHVEWQDVEVAKGDTTILRGDVVTIR